MSRIRVDTRGDVFRTKPLAFSPALRSLDDKIRKIIEEEIARAKSKDLKNTNYSLTPEAIALSREFSNNKGKLPWPLKKGIIISKYGTQKHSVFAGIETFNNGIN